MKLPRLTESQKMASVFITMGLAALGSFVMIAIAFAVGGLSLKGDATSNWIMALCFTPAAVWGIIVGCTMARGRQLVLNLIYTVPCTALACVCWYAIFVG